MLLQPALHPAHRAAQVNPAGAASHPAKWQATRDSARLGRMALLNATLQAGDILFLPAMWLHHVTALTPALSLNVWSGCVLRLARAVRRGWGQDAALAFCPSSAQSHLLASSPTSPLPHHPTTLSFRRSFEPTLLAEEAAAAAVALLGNGVDTLARALRAQAARAFLSLLLADIELSLEMEFFPSGQPALADEDARRVYLAGLHLSMRRYANVGQSEAAPEAELCDSAEAFQDLLASGGFYLHAMQSALAEIVPRLKEVCSETRGAGQRRRGSCGVTCRGLTRWCLAARACRSRPARRRRGSRRWHSTSSSAQRPPSWVRATCRPLSTPSRGARRRAEWRG